MNIYSNNFTNPFQPTCLADFVISDEASRKQLEAIVDGSLPFPVFGKNAILLHGLNGSGKTTLALLLPQLLEKSAKLIGSTRSTEFFSSDVFWQLTTCAMGMNSVATLASINARSRNTWALSNSGWHYEILDEVDLLTKAAQASLKTTITFAKSTIFILTTNHLPKLDKGLRDRSVLVEMNQPKAADCVPLAQRFFRQMGLKGDEVEAAVFEQIAQASRGSLRDFGTAVATLGIRLGGAI